MANQIFSGLFNLILAIALGVSIYRARRDKQLKITFISDPMTKVEKSVITGRLLTVTTIIWGISAILLILSGLGILFSYIEMEIYHFMTITSFIVLFIAFLIMRFATPNSKG